MSTLDCWTIVHCGIDRRKRSYSECKPSQSKLYACLLYKMLNVKILSSKIHTFKQGSKAVSSQPIISSLPSPTSHLVHPPRRPLIPALLRKKSL